MKSMPHLVEITHSSSAENVTLFDKLSCLFVFMVGIVCLSPPINEVLKGYLLLTSNMRVAVLCMVRCRGSIIISQNINIVKNVKN